MHIKREGSCQIEKIYNIYVQIHNFYCQLKFFDVKYSVTGINTFFI